MLAPRKMLAPVAKALNAQRTTHIMPISNCTLREAVLRFFDDRANSEALDGPIADWDTSEVTDMSELFLNREHFNEELRWDVRRVTDMSGMFRGCRRFDCDIGHFNVESVTTMRAMFHGCISFNCDIGNWKVANVTDMSLMFSQANLFDQDISRWNVSQLTTSKNMFIFAVRFRCDLGSWNVSNVTDMRLMFAYAPRFNSNLEDWNVQRVLRMDSMFKRAENFDSNLEKWKLSTNINTTGMFDDACSFSWLLNASFDDTQPSWKKMHAMKQLQQQKRDKDAIHKFLDPIKAWRTLAAHKAYLPGGAGYLKAVESYSLSLAQLHYQQLLAATV